MVVDDEKDFCDFMAGHLQRRGYSVDKAYTGEDALKCIKSGGPYAVLVTDLNMPGMDGIELLRHGRTHDPNMETVVISANDVVERAISAMREHGAYDYLLKPLASNNELSMSVGRASEHRRLRMEREQLQAQRLADAERLKILIANTADAILAIDADGKIALVNPAATHLLGKDLVGQEALAVLPPVLVTLVNNWQTVGGRRAAVVEASLGNDSMQTVSLTPLPVSPGKIGGWVMVLRDVTHLKRLDEFKGRLLAEAANKIQVPLAQAIAAVVELNELTSAINSEKYTKALYGLGRTLDQIRRWMDEIMLIGRIEAGIGMRPETINMPRLLQDWSQTVNKKLLKDKSLGLSFTVPETVPAIYADRELLQRLLQQLIDQIALATKPDSKNARALRITVRHSDEQIWLDVTGEGFPIRRTDPLRRLTRPLSNNRKNDSSPDLALVTTIAHAVGGQVWVRDQGPSGNAVVICIPAVRRAQL
jgi:PAS domain S-box-containing protein